MATRPKQYAATGPWCSRCHKRIQGPPIEYRSRKTCVSCFLRPYVIVQIAERLQRQTREMSA